MAICTRQTENKHTYHTKPWAPPPFGCKLMYLSGTQNSVSPKICRTKPSRTSMINNIYNSSKTNVYIFK